MLSVFCVGEHMGYALIPHPQRSSIKSSQTIFIMHSGLLVCYIVKGKATQLQALTGPEGSRKLRLPDFKTIGT
jgi:hypothetical protein